jgi:hypothetical protein
MPNAINRMNIEILEFILPVMLNTTYRLSEVLEQLTLLQYLNTKSVWLICHILPEDFECGKGQVARVVFGFV